MSPDPQGCEKQLAELEAENERLREWVKDLQSGMFINCVYCGHRYGPKDEVPASMADVLTAHVEKCSEHPLSAAKERIADLEGAVRDALWNLGEGADAGAAMESLAAVLPED
jgi:hypothetical protein